MLKACAIGVIRLLLALLLTALIVMAVYVSIGRYYIGYVEQYQQQLVERLSQASGLVFKVDSLSGRWSKLAPILTMEKLTVYATEAKQHSVLNIDRLIIKINPLQSLLKRAVQVQHLYIDGVKCSLQEASPGRWQLAGYPADYQAGGDLDKLVDLLLSVRGAELLNAQLALQFAKGSESQLSLQELSLKHSDNFRRLRLQASFEQSDKPLTAIIEAQGDPRQQANFSGRGYLKLDDIDFSSQLPLLDVFGIELRDARVDSEVWVDWLPNTLITVQGSIATPLVDIAAISGEPLQPLKKVAINFRAEKTSQYDWQGWIPNVSSEWQGQSFQIENLHIEVKKDQLRLVVPELDLAQLSGQLLAIELLNDKLKDVLSTLAVSGRMENLWLTLFRKPEPAIDSAAGTAPRFLLNANLRAVALSPWQGAPGASGVSGYLALAPARGRVELDSQEFSLQFPRIYHSPLAFKTALGQLSWQLADGRMRLDSGPIKLTAEHGPATVLLNLDIPTQAGAEIAPTMTLAVGLTDTDAKYRDKFIPFILNADFLQWMQGSVPSGHVQQGGFLYRGSLRQGESDHRTVQLFFDIDHTVLDYHPDWPALTDIAGLVEINDAEVRVTASKAKLFELALPRAIVQASPLAAGGMWLTVDASAYGSASDALRVVNESAVQKLVGGVFSKWQLSGDSRADVVLGIPLAGASKKTEIEVKVQLAAAQLGIPEYRLDFSALGGQLNYSSKSGLSSSGLTAKLYDKPLTVDIREGADKAVQVRVDGRIDMRDVERWSQQSALVFTEGETDFSAQITMAGNSDSAFSVQSNLLGVAIDLPAPFYKQPMRAQPFWLKLPLGEPQPLLRMGFSKLAELQLQFSEGQLNSGLLLIGQAEGSGHENHRLTVTGKLDKFVLAEWQPVLQRYLQHQPVALPQADPLAETETDTDTERTVAGDDSPVLQVKVHQLQLGEFIGFDQQFKQSLVSVQRQPESWLISASNAQLEGDVSLPDHPDAPLRVALKRLNLPATVLSPVESSEPVKPFEALQIDFSVQQFQLADQTYGSLAFELRSQAEAMLFNKIHGNIRGLEIAEANPLTLEWGRSGGADSSRLFGEFSLADLGRVLENWNYERIIASKKGRVAIDLSWPGRPDQWQLQHSTGPIYLKIENGRFLKISDTATGTLKVVGIVNFMNIARRLQLDFSDLYKSGISFDEIEGEIVLGNSQLKIVDDLKVTSPSSRFYLRGNADLIAKQLDMELIATLPVASNLPWIVALAGGLPTAAGVYVASKIFEDQMDRFSSAIYTVSGDWNNPEMQFDRVFDDGKKSRTRKTTEPVAAGKSSADGVDAQQPPVDPTPPAMESQP